MFLSVEKTKTKLSSTSPSRLKTTEAQKVSKLESEDCMTSLLYRYTSVVKLSAKNGLCGF